MSTQQLPSQIIPPMPTKKPKAKRKWLMPLLLGFALLIGIGVGSTKPAPPPVTIEKPVDKIVEKEKRVEVPVTPPECIKALALSEQVITLSGEALGYSGDAMKAATNMDVAGIYAANDKIKTVSPKLTAITDPLTSAKATCRASAK
jgi:hypothetical protein